MPHKQPDVNTLPLMAAVVKLLCSIHAFGKQKNKPRRTDRYTSVCPKEAQILYLLYFSAKRVSISAHSALVASPLGSMR